MKYARDSFCYIRNYYKVPAMYGVRVTTSDDKSGTIVASHEPYLAVRLDGENFARLYHPMDLKYEIPSGPIFCDKGGRILFVCDGISDGRSWGTFYCSSSGSLRRFRGLPMRRTRAEAEHDLAAYAAAKGLARVKFTPGGERDDT